jgi:hypothetical protein
MNNLETNKKANEPANGCLEWVGFIVALICIAIGLSAMFA